MQKLSSQINLYFFSFVSAIVAFGFPLMNFTLTIDSEIPIDPDYSLAFGRWGTNIIRFHVFDGLYPYYTLLVGLFFMSIAAVEMTKLLKIEGMYRYFFILLFLSFPQHAYQLMFTMQADVIGIAYFTSTMAVSIYSKLDSKNKIMRVIQLISIVALLLFALASYQAMIIIPILLYAMYFIRKWDAEKVNKIKEWIDVLYFMGILLITVVLYYISNKFIIKVDLSDGYVASYYTDGNNLFSNFFSIFYENITGKFYYGEKLYALVPIGILLGIIISIKEKKYFWVKLLAYIFLLFFPFAISLFTRSDANPPRIYVGSTIVFAFVLTHVLSKFNFKNILNTYFIISLLFLWNVFFITNLFYTANKIYKQDLHLAHNINDDIQKNIKNFNSKEDYVYFYGKTPKNNYENIIIPKSNVFAGSIFNWDDGNNKRIINFFRFENIAYYKFLDDKKEYMMFKDSIKNMPIYPNEGSIKKFNNTLVVKLSYNKGNTSYLQDEHDVDSIYIQKKVLKIEPFKIDLIENIEIMGGVDQFAQNGNNISLKGWVAYAKKPSDETEISLILFNKNQSFLVETNRDFRGDVSDYLNDRTDYNSSGYIADFDVSQLPKGTYEVRLRVKQLNSAIDGYKPGYKTIEVK